MVLNPTCIVPSGYRNYNQPNYHQSSEIDARPEPQFDFKEEFSKPLRKYPNNNGFNSRPVIKTTTNYAQQIYDDNTDELHAPGYHSTGGHHSNEDITPYLNSYDAYHETANEGMYSNKHPCTLIFFMGFF